MRPTDQWIDRMLSSPKSCTHDIPSRDAYLVREMAHGSNFAAAGVEGLKL